MPGDGDEPFAASANSDDTKGGDPDVKPVRRFTWKELSKLNEPHNAHVAVRGKVGAQCQTSLIVTDVILNLSEYIGVRCE